MLNSADLPDSTIEESKVTTFGKFDRLLGRVVLAIVLLLAYGKMLSDFAEFYITGHTTNFFWFFGDLFFNPSKPSNNAGPYSMFGLMMLAVLGWANLHLWVKECTWFYNLLAPYAERGVEKFSGYVVNRLMKASFGKGRKARLTTRILLGLTKMGKALEEDKQASRKRRVERLEKAVEDAKTALEEAREDLQ